MRFFNHFPCFNISYITINLEKKGIEITIIGFNISYITINLPVSDKDKVPFNVSIYPILLLIFPLPEYSKVKNSFNISYITINQITVRKLARAGIVSIYPILLLIGIMHHQHGSVRQFQYILYYY